MTGEKILEVDDIKMHFPVYKGLIFRKQTACVKAVDGITIDLRQGETLGLVGESGCGKSTFGRTIMRLYEPTSGRIRLCGKDLTGLSGAELADFRVSCQMIFQDPYASLNPRMTVFDIIAEPIRTHKQFENRKDLEKKISSLMHLVGLSPRFIKKYPHEFSGGQRQRIAIARALAINPKLIICDEPVSALDVSIQSQIINLLKDLQKNLGLSYIFIAHDIAVVKHISDRIAVMYLGKIVEEGSKQSIFLNPQHPYTKALLGSVPLADPRKEKERTRVLIKGDLPSPLNPPSGCAFHTRCPLATQECTHIQPQLKENSSFKDHKVACIHV